MVVGEQGRVVGVLDPLDLLSPAAPDTPLRALARHVVTVLPDMPVAAAVRLTAWNTRNSLPVVDFNGALLGHVMHTSLLAAADRMSGVTPGNALAEACLQYFDTLGVLLGVLLTGRR